MVVVGVAVGVGVAVVVVVGVAVGVAVVVVVGVAVGVAVVVVVVVAMTLNERIAKRKVQVAFQTNDARRFENVSYTNMMADNWELAE